ncbi:MAG: HipA N-terminal domain-containing protein [Rhodothermaceae bacterium]
MNKKARVKINGIPAGILSKDESGFYFEYLEEYLSEINNPAISLTLPKKSEKFFSKSIFPFFYGLLSEGRNKELQCRILKIDEKDYFTRLIKTASSDTIGAITVEEIK